MTTELDFNQQLNKNMAISYLSQTDWAVSGGIADPAQSNPYLLNQEEFLQYRSHVRAIAVNPPSTSCVFTNPPVAIWETIPPSVPESTWSNT